MREGPHTLTFRGVLTWLSGAGLAGLVLWYAIFQARFLIAGPSLNLAEDTPVLHHTRLITVAGIASNVIAITLNDRPIFTDKEGRFSERLVLEDGYTILTLRARDRYGREAVLEQPFIYVRPSVPEQHEF